MKKNQHKSNQKTTKEPKSIWIGFGIVLLASLGAYFYYSPPASLSTVPKVESISQGKVLFDKNCQSCHGPGARGQDIYRPMGGTASNGDFIAPALNGTGHAWHHPDEMLFNNIKNGSMANNSPMKGFKDKLDDKEIVSIMHYFKSLWPEKIRISHARRSKNS